MIHFYADHYRIAQKNLFTGESLVLFMTPPATPGAAPSAPEGAEGVLSGGLDSHARKRVEEKKKITEFMKELVPEKAWILPDDQIEVREGWIELMGEYNGVQSQINVLLEQKKKFTDPDSLKNDPNFRNTYKTFYSQLAQLESLESMNLGGVDWDDLRRKASGEREATTTTINDDLDRVIAALVARRQLVWDCIEERIHSDFDRRLQNLRNIWANNPPAGYESAQDDWLEYLDNITEKIKAHHFEDTEDPEHPSGEKYFDELKALWNSIADSESTVEMWRDGQDHDLTIPGLLEEIDELENEAHGILSPDLVGKYQKAVDDVTGPLESVIAQLRKERGISEDADQLDKLIKKMKKQGGDEEEIRELDEILSMEKMLKELKDSRDVEARVDEMINSDEPSKVIVRSGKTFTLPTGIRKQLEFLRTLPANDTEAKHMLYRMNDAIKSARDYVHDTERHATEVLPNFLLKVKLMQDKLNEPKPSRRRKLMQISGPKTWSVLKHVVTSLFERSYERDNKRKAGIFGREAFKFLESVPGLKDYEFLRPFSEIATEADTEREHAETEGYQHYEKMDEHMPIYEMVHIMHTTTNEFRFRALIGLLCKKGRMRWDDEGFYKQLNRFQTRVHVPENLDRHMEDRVQSEELIKEAVFGIYGDVDIYRDWVSKNASSLKSEKQNKSARYGELSETYIGKTSALKVKIDSILETYKKDMAAGKHFSDADPVEYEAILDYAIAQGKLDNEDILYYMIQGIGSGHMGQPGLLPLERASEMTGQNNSYPAIETFASPTKRGSRPTLADTQEWAQMTKDEYIHWYHSYVMYLPKVRQRLNKAQSQGIKMDHDYFTGTAAYLSATSIEGLLRANETGGYGLQTTAVQNGSVGMLFGLDVLAEEYTELGEAGKDGLSRMADMITRFDGIITGRMYRKDNKYLRMDYTSMHKEKPRYVGAYESFFGRGDMTTADNLETIRGYFRILDRFDPDFPLFNKLFDNGFATDQDAIAFAEGLMLAHPGVFGEAPAPQGIDGLYQVIGAYVAHIAKERPDIVREMNQKIIADHRAAGKSVEELKHHREEQAQHFREAYSQQVKEGRSAHGHGGHGDHGHGEHGEHGEHDEHGHGEDHGHGGHGGGHGHDEHPEEGHGAAANNGFHYDDHAQGAHRSTHGQHRRAA